VCCKVTTYRFSAVIERTSGATNIGMLGISGGVSTGFDTTGNAYVSGGTILDLAAANSSWHAVNSLANGNGTASVINVDGTDQTGAASTAGISANTLRAVRVSSLTGTVALAEGGVWNAATASTDRGNLNTNQHSATNGYNF
jgi:hypothetical protein